MATSSTVVKQLVAAFPGFSEVKRARWQPIENVLPPITDSELAQEEKLVKVKLPESYKKFLRITRGFSSGNGSVQIGGQHPFFHDGPLPSGGMLCFAEMFMLGDGDQALFDVKRGLKKGEYPVYYYAHDWPKIIHIFDGFEDFMNGFLKLPGWGGDEPD